jgi:protein-L-isoaspartate(D-aspartate) O-methyltransferase
MKISNAQEERRWQRLREKMVVEQLEKRGIKDPRLLSAFREIPRHLFVPEKYRNEAYDDGPLPIGYGQTISQPYIVAYMIQLLNLQPHYRVLEIGTGSGYQTAILCRLVKEVYSMDIIPQFVDNAAKVLKKLGIENCHLRTGNGYHGWPEAAPFEAIIVSAAPPEIPEALPKQLSDGGRMAIPVGKVSQQIRLLTKTSESVEIRNFIPVRFVPMVDR